MLGPLFWRIIYGSNVKVHRERKKKKRTKARKKSAKKKKFQPGRGEKNNRRHVQERRMTSLWEIPCSLRRCCTSPARKPYSGTAYALSHILFFPFHLSWLVSLSRNRPLLWEYVVSTCFTLMYHQNIGIFLFCFSCFPLLGLIWSPFVLRLSVIACLQKERDLSLLHDLNEASHQFCRRTTKMDLAPIKKILAQWPPSELNLQKRSFDRYVRNFRVMGCSYIEMGLFLHLASSQLDGTYYHWCIFSL